MNRPPSPFPSIEPADLINRLHSDPKPIILDVLPPEAHAEAHIPGSLNCCVYEISFIEKMESVQPDKAAPIIVHGFDDNTLEAEEALHKLQQDGYVHLSKLAGGLQGWRVAGGEVEAHAAPAPPASSGVFGIDTDASVIFWTGQNLLNHHHGSIQLAGGEIEVSGDRVLRGEIAVEMKSIRSLDLEDHALATALAAHLRSEDFFAATRFPLAEFHLDRIDPVSSAAPGLPNFHVYGVLMLRGISHAIDFPAVIALRPEGGYTAQAHVEIDRTRWGVLYGSGRFFARLGQHLVNDLIYLHLKIVTHSTPRSDT